MRRQGEVAPGEMPDSTLHLVLRTRERVILDDAAAPNPFSADAYFRPKRVRSVLCLPLLKQAELIGLLYLENNLASHVFTPARIAVLELLAAQAAISLENASLYTDLLQENHERRTAEAALRRSEAYLAEAQRLSRTGSFGWKSTGMGMGLAICKTIVEAHGGQLWASPNQPHGVIFEFRLPADGRASDK